MERELQLIVKLITTQAQASAKAMEGSFARLGKVADGAVNAVKRFGAGLIGFGKTIGKALLSVKALVGALALFLGLSKVVGILSDLNKEIDTLGKLADRMGLTTAQLSALQVGAELAGSSAEELNMALGQLQRRAAVKGDFRDLYSILGEVADQMKNATTEGERLRISSENFGEELGGRMVLLLRDGSASLEQFAAEAERLGVAFDGRAVAGAAKLSDEMFRLRLAIKGVFAGLLREGTPALISILETATDLIVNNRDAIISFVKTVVSGIVMATLALVDFVNMLRRIDKDSLENVIQTFFVNLSLRFRILATEFSIALKESFSAAFAGTTIMGRPFLQFGDDVQNAREQLKILNVSLEQNKTEVAALFNTAKATGFTAIFVAALQKEAKALQDAANAAKKYNREIGGLEQTLIDFTKGTKEGFREIAKEMRDVAGAVGGAFQSAFSGARGAMVGFFEDLYSGTLKAEDAFKKFFQALVQQLISLAAELTVIVLLGILINALLPGIGAAFSGVGGAAGAIGGASVAVGNVANGTGGTSGGGNGLGPAPTIPAPTAPPSFIGPSPSVPNGDQIMIREDRSPAPRAMMDTGASGSKGGGVTVININAMDAQSFAGFVAKPENAKTLRAQQNSNNVLRDSTRGSLR